MFLRRCFFFFLLSAITTPLFSQGADPTTGKVNFKSRVNVVIVNVVVTDLNGNPVPGLVKDDFKVSEEGRTQKVLSFDEHKGIPAKITKLPILPPHVFTNFPATKTADAIDVILLDTLNTPMEDQSYVYLQVTKYLKTMQSGAPVALFTLGSQLRMVQGFTTDSSVLLSALRDKKKGGNPQPSPMLRTNIEDNADQQLVGEMKSMQAVDGSQTLQESIASSTIPDTNQGVPEQFSRRYDALGISANRAVSWRNSRTKKRNMVFSCLPAPALTCSTRRSSWIPA